MEGRTDRPGDDIEFVTIVRGDDVLDGPNVRKEAIINDLDAYTVFFEGSPPNTPDVNWEEEMVVAVALGARATGGYYVEITSITHQIIGYMRGSVEIRYIETVSSGVTIDAPTYPYHAVKCQRVGYHYNFIRETEG